MPKIYDEDVALPSFEAAIEWLRQRGIEYSIPKEEIKFSLITELIPAQFRHQDGEPTFGITHIQGPQGGCLKNSIVNVTILRGLPKLHLVGFSLHELGHVWLFDNDLQHLPPSEAEGFCEYLRFEYFASTKTDEGELQMRRMERNENPIYGGGLRGYLGQFPIGHLSQLLAYLVGKNAKGGRR